MTAVDTRTHAERSADNALASARLKRVEARLQDVMDKLGALPARTRVDAAAVWAALDQAMKAPAG